MPSLRVIVGNVGHAKSPDAIARRLRQLLPAHGRWVVLGCEGHRYAGQLDPLGGTVHQEPFDRSKARIPWENPDRGRAEVFVITGPDVDVDGAEAEEIMAGPNPPTKYQSDRWVQRVYTHVDGVPMVFVSWHGQANIQRGGVVNPLSRMARAGCSAGVCAICLRMSGEALTSSQSSPVALMAMDDWVRARAWMLPLRKPSQLAQLQFHCGKPPPAAEPST